MKSVSLLFAAIVIVFSLPACATKKADCCSGSSCTAPDSKSTTGHTHKKSS